MRAGAAAKSTIFIILLMVQANVAAADPLPSLGMPSNAQAHYDPATDSVEVTWGPPSDAEPDATFSYEVRKDNVVVYTGSEFSFVDTTPNAVVTYAITAYNGNTRGVAAVSFVAPYPHCYDPVQTNPPYIKWACFFPIP